MRRFFFHLHECGVVTLDHSGELKLCEAAARDFAIAAARDIMQADLATGHLCLSGHIDVQDETGRLVMIVPFKDAVTISGH